MSPQLTRRTRRRWRASVIGALPMLLVSAAAAQSAAAGWHNDPAHVRLGYETVTLPGDEKMGLLGATYLVEARPGLCIGPGVYSAVSGQRGGLFVVGGEAALCMRLMPSLSLQAGLFVGGGGGGAAPVGGGLMLRPHVDLLWDFGRFRAGLSASNVSFPNGNIGSNQIGVVLETDSLFSYHAAGDYPGGAVPPRQGGGMGFDRITAVATLYSPHGGGLGNSGTPMAAYIGLVGARGEAQWGDHVYAGIEASGAVNSSASGYAELLGLLGTRTVLFDDRLTLGVRVAVGAGGGGDIPTGGGLLLKAASDLRVQVSRDLALQIEGGYATAPQGTLHAPFAALGLQWNLSSLPGQPARPVRQEFAFGVETYVDAQRRAGPAQSLQSVSLRFNRYIGEHVYVSGQAQSAYAGDAGAFAAGLIGAGAQWSLGRWSWGAELLVGAAGGGGVDSGGGIVRPTVFAGFEVSPAIVLQASAGRVRAFSGSLDSNVFGVSVVFPFIVAGLP